jgi:coenzyme F420-0:L-glutamate ligase/coenzyme F420-1:gamma-L-glutamate ligase
MTAATVTLVAPRDFPMIGEGDALPGLIVDCLGKADITLQSGDIVVLAQKVISKAEGRSVALSSVTPSTRAVDLGEQCAKDPRLVELILSEADEVMRVRPGVIIVRHRLGLVLANAGIDRSNVAPDSSGSDDRVLLLPVDPDATCSAIRDELKALTGADVAVLIIDSLGRAWRNGTVGTAIGASGIPAVADLRGNPDLFGRPLETTEIGLGDEIAAAASLLMGQADEGRPLVLLRGMELPSRQGAASDLVRPRSMDLFP